MVLVRLGIFDKTPLGTLYWWSEIVNDWIRYSQAGLDRLGQNNSFVTESNGTLSYLAFVISDEIADLGCK